MSTDPKSWEAYLLAKLAEEAAEVGQMACKALVFGLESQYPDPDSPSTRDRLEGELVDLQTVMHLLGLSGAPDPGLRPAMAVKTAKLVRYALACGYGVPEHLKPIDLDQRAVSVDSDIPAMDRPVTPCQPIPLPDRPPEASTGSPVFTGRFTGPVCRECGQSHWVYGPCPPPVGPAF